MTKQTEAMKLEAVYETIIQWDEGGGKRSRRELARRIVALAEQPAQQEMPDDWFKGMPEEYRREAWRIKEQPAQQEPDDKRVIELATRYGLDHSMIGALRNFADAYSGKSLSYQKIDLSEDQLQRLTTKVSFIPGLVMDTSPPAQRKPLTDEWIRARCDKAWVFETVKQWVRAIEAAHGITGETK